LQAWLARIARTMKDRAVLFLFLAVFLVLLMNVGLFVLLRKARQQIPGVYVQEGTVSLYRLYSQTDQNHFYTASASERDIAIGRGYTDEGIAGYIYPSQEQGTTPLYVLYNATFKDHFYTINESDKTYALNHGYADYGIAGYIYSTQQPDTVPFYQLWHDGRKDHFYTASEEEKNISVTSLGYTYERIEGYIYVQAPASPSPTPTPSLSPTPSPSASPSPTPSPSGSPTPPTTFMTSYSNIKNYFGNTHRILSFSGTTYISEFDDNSGVYAGHLGSFWAPLGQEAVYSTHLTRGQDRSGYWRNAFAHGLVFYNRDTGQCQSESLSSFTEGAWYPSKLVVTHEYQTPFKGKLTGIKMGIPEYQGFALKLKLENKDSKPLNLNLLSFSMLNSIDKSLHILYPATDSEPENKKGVFRYDSANKVVVFSASHIANTQLAVGFDQGNLLSSYKLGNQGSNIASDFCDNGILNDIGSDSSGIDGSEAGLATQLPVLSPGQVHELTVYFVFSPSTSPLSGLLQLRDKDIEQKVDTFWNQRLVELVSQIPELKINDPSLEQLYLNSFLNILMNHFDDKKGRSFYGLGDKEYIAQFPWQAVSVSSVWAWADPAGFKETIRNFLKVDLTRCKAYNPVTGANYCYTYYSFDPSTIILAIYDYLTISEDWAFLSENVSGKTILQWLRDLAYLRESTNVNNPLVDFGDDDNLYEFRGEDCQLKGLYTGKVSTPNGERYMVHKKLAEIYRKIGDDSSADAEEQAAEFVKQHMGGLWNASQNWFDTISLYGGSGNLRSTPLRNTFKAVGILHLLDYPGLLSDEQKTGLLSNLDEFVAPYGLYSVSKVERQKWCSRADWHGPGIYIGELGRLIGTLFQSNQTEKAYQILQSLNFMVDSPYFAQCTDGDSPRFASPASDGCGATAYLEGASFAQAFITGMFGVRPQADGVKIAPRIPTILLSRGQVSLSNIKIGDKIYAVKVDSNFTYASISQTGTNAYEVFVPNNTEILVKDGQIVNGQLDPACQYDYIGDGIIDFNDLLDALAHWATVGINGFLGVLSGWGVSCE